MKAIVYATSHCPECNVLKMFLRDYQIEFEVRNCTTTPAYWEDVKNMGFLGVPVTIVNDKPIQGFNPEEIMKEVEAAKGK
ncbi:glutaredoxin family protein [Ammoniphilus sp. YIM 78166]|uniref:glutaredoxin family protein n=1 Tax=Ammoniphilus sp. YIM 78166 TaxID=1644106 RepID=UPI00106F7CF9|nr:glutaredoxin family protein [Ammoniphilus sp. YIM 78166]